MEPINGCVVIVGQPLPHSGIAQCMLIFADMASYYRASLIFLMYGIETAVMRMGAEELGVFRYTSTICVRSHGIDEPFLG